MLNEDRPWYKNIGLDCKGEFWDGLATLVLDHLSQKSVYGDRKAQADDWTLKNAYGFTREWKTDIIIWDQELNQKGINLHYPGA